MIHSTEGNRTSQVLRYRFLLLRRVCDLCGVPAILRLRRYDRIPDVAKCEGCGRYGVRV
jgi:hypothetical protein